MNFDNDTWSDILKKATKEEKIIFLDAYTTWCGPCRIMKQEVFPDEEVGQFYNENFINVQMDMESGEGLILGKKYDVSAYPTLLFISPEGKLLHKSVGFMPAEALLDLGKAALKPETQLSNMEVLYEKGLRNPEFLHDFAFSSYQARTGKHNEAAKAFLETQKNWETTEALTVIFLFTEAEDDELFNFMVENREAFEPIFGKQQVVQRIQHLILTRAFKGSLQSEEASLAEVERLYKKAFPNAGEEMSAHFFMNYYNQVGNTEKFIEFALDYYSNAEVKDYLELNNIAWRFYETVEDKAMLEKALEWAEKSVNLNSQYFNNDTVAALLYKLGRKKQAKKAAQRAIEIGKANGENVSGTEALLQRIGN